jgi:hypothetical protein
MAAVVAVVAAEYLVGVHLVDLSRPVGRRLMTKTKEALNQRMTLEVLPRLHRQVWLESRL